jgi:hypothetical protein
LLTPQQLNEIPGFVTNLYFDYMGINKENKADKTEQSKSEKN